MRDDRDDFPPGYVAGPAIGASLSPIFPIPMPGARSATACALACVALLGLAALGAGGGGEGHPLERVAAEPARSIGYWWGCPETADDPKVDGMIAWVKQHKNIVSTLIMNCGECPGSASVALHAPPRDGRARSQASPPATRTTPRRAAATSAA